MSNIDNVVPGDKWEFDAEVADCFSDMLSRSIPQYDVMRDTSASLATDIIQQNNAYRDFNLLDIGCSDGLMIQTLLQKLKGNKGRILGVDISEPMLQKAEERFKLNNGVSSISVAIQNCDLRYAFPKNNYDVITSILSIQFIPIEYRQTILQNIYDNLVPGGAFIFVEKVLGNTADLNKLFVKEYYDLKKQNGYSEDQIERKRLSLEGVLVPVTSDWNKSLLQQAGFRQIDDFWRWMNFVGYIAIK